MSLQPTAKSRYVGSWIGRRKRFGNIEPLGGADLGKLGRLERQLDIWREKHRAWELNE